MTNPTPLSQAAQAVLDAANNAYWLWDQMCPADANVIAAAAMLTAVQQWLYDEGFDDAGDALDEEIQTAEDHG